MKILRSKSYPRPLLYTLAGIIVLIILYLVVYQLAPFPAPWSDLFLVYAIAVAAFAAAIFATFVWLTFRVDDKPRRVWKYFALGWWCWAISELIWAIYYLFNPEVPAVSLADPLWIVGYFLFGAAFLFQFRLVLDLPRRKEMFWTGVTVAATLALTLIVAVLLVNFGPESELTWGETFLTVFYATGDLALMVGAIKLGRIFGRGLWGQAWLGLLAFTVSDTLYFWATYSGLYAYGVETNNLITLAVDSIYLLAYCLIALACHIHYLLIRFGPTLRPIPPAEPLE